VHILLVVLLYIVLNLSNYSKANIIDRYNYKVIPLPGKLNDILQINSNNPEILSEEGIILSTFPEENRKFANAHLNYAIEGRFDIFTHHIGLRKDIGDFTLLYQGILMQNASNKEATIKIIKSSFYNNYPDAPFIDNMDSNIRNDEGIIFSGTGDRVAQDIIRNKNLLGIQEIKLKPYEYYLLLNEPFYVFPFLSRNAKTVHFSLETNSPIYIANLSMYERNKLFFWKDSKPSLNDWIDLLNNSNLLQQRDKIATPLEDFNEDLSLPFFYSRVSGIVIGNKWESKITNNQELFYIPGKNQGIAYVINSLFRNTYGTKQNQSANILKRYENTSYQSYGNYGIEYEIEIPLYNHFNEYQLISINFSSPIRFIPDEEKDFIEFYRYPENKINFRGDIKIEYENFLKNKVTKYIHLVQRFGEEGLPIASFLIAPNEKRNLKINFIYPADCTPPHTLIISNN
jgi:hypothetical protein